MSELSPLARRAMATNDFPEAYPLDPEPCDDCTTGVLYMECFDGKRRCRHCVRTLARANGWDIPPEPPPTPVPAVVPTGPPPPTLVAALRAERKEQELAKAAAEKELELDFNASST